MLVGRGRCEDAWRPKRSARVGRRDGRHRFHQVGKGGDEIASPSGRGRKLVVFSHMKSEVVCSFTGLR